MEPQYEPFTHTHTYILQHSLSLTYFSPPPSHSRPWSSLLFPLYTQNHHHFELKPIRSRVCTEAVSRWRPEACPTTSAFRRSRSSWPKLRSLPRMPTDVTTRSKTVTVFVCDVCFCLACMLVLAWLWTRTWSHGILKKIIIDTTSN